jgi:hypothetical protein
VWLQLGRAGWVVKCSRTGAGSDGGGSTGLFLVTTDVIIIDALHCTRDGWNKHKGGGALYSCDVW